MLLIFMDLGMAIGSVVLGTLAKYVDYGISSIAYAAILLIYIFATRKKVSVK